METTKYKGERIHVGCGGVVFRGKCLKCGDKKERRNIGETIFGKGPLVIKGGEEKSKMREEHRTRIREGRDIFK